MTHDMEAFLLRPTVHAALFPLNGAFVDSLLTLRWPLPSRDLQSSRGDMFIGVNTVSEGIWNMLYLRQKQEAPRRLSCFSPLSVVREGFLEEVSLS